MKATIREGGAADADALAALYGAAFPDEDLVPLVRALLVSDDVLSLVATGSAGDPIGHVALSECLVTDGDTDHAGTGGEVSVALLGPLAVAPAHRRQGLGGALIRAGTERMRAVGAVAVLVLGDPAYYARHGFRPERGIAPPYPLPGEWRDAWQSIAFEPAHGSLRVPEPWRDPALWNA